NRYEPLLKFPLALLYLSIIYYFSSLKLYTLTQIYLNISKSVNNTLKLLLTFTFIIYISFILKYLRKTLTP
ncbi:hypothetical protein CONLIGDRAFT_578153, partial [Coniochaeta ligniaria NRRL 30616]